MKSHRYLLVALLLLTFFVISFLTNIIGPLVPDIIRSFDLSLTLAALLPFAFFIAYGVMSIPSGMLVEKYGNKKVMLFAFFLAFLGAFLFAIRPGYRLYSVSLFVIGTGMAMLQVAMHPLLRVVGGEEHFAFNSVLAQLFFGLASFVSPLVYSYLVTNIAHPDGASNAVLRVLESLVPETMPWIALYWLFALIALVMLGVISLTRFPPIELRESEKVGALQTHLDLLRSPVVILFWLGIFAYIGTEQGIANWLSKFLELYHGVNPQTTGARTVSLFWGFLTAGTVLGLVLLKFLDSRTVLIAFSLGALVCLSGALFGSRPVALAAFPLTGFAFSVMWSIILSLALNSVPAHHGSFSGILLTGISGGAVIPLVVGSLGDRFGLRFGMLFLYLTIGYILSIGFWSKPLIHNLTVSRQKAAAREDT